jgi:hypothetical protein
MTHAGPACPQTMLPASDCPQAGQQRCPSCSACDETPVVMHQLMPDPAPWACGQDWSSQRPAQWLVGVLACDSAWVALFRRQHWICLLLWLQHPELWTLRRHRTSQHGRCPQLRSSWSPRTRTICTRNGTNCCVQYTQAITQQYRDTGHAPAETHPERVVVRKRHVKAKLVGEKGLQWGLCDNHQDECRHKTSNWCTDNTT